MKKYLTRISLGIGTIGIIVAGAAAFSAFEAHVVNVTATIENALTVPVEKSGLSFGEVFPEEVSHLNLPISLSNSFMSTDRVDDVEYIIRQKPKCGIPSNPLVGDFAPVSTSSVVSYSGFTQVTEVDGRFVCPQGSVQLPLLCPYLSKNELDANGKPTGNGISAFHGLPGPWTETTTENTQVAGVLSKELGKTSTSWDIDLHTPCFKGQCAQDWPAFVQATNASVTDPTIYEADPASEHQMFGCDLWIEVTNISLPNGSAALTVTKVVIGTSTPASAFSLFVDGASVTSGIATSTTPGAHVVSEGAHAGFNSVISGDCDASGNVTTSTTTPAFCTITNTFIPQTPTTGQLTVTKVVVGSTTPVSAFSLFVDGASVTSGSATTTSLGAHVVSEGAHDGFTSVISGDCDVSGNVTVSTSTPASCTVTNTATSGAIIVHKVVSDPGQLGGQTAGQFQMQIDGNDVAQDATTTVTVGTHVVSEVDSKGDTVSFSVDCDSSGHVTVANGDVKHCTVTNTIPFFTLTVTKSVITDNGGKALISDFNYFVDTTQVNSGVPHNFKPGTYTVTESGLSGYEATFGGDCNKDSQQVTGAAGNNLNCTIVNNDIPPHINLIKNVVGGTATATSFILRVDGTPVPTGGSKAVTAYDNHFITEDQQAGYTLTSITGAGCPSSTSTPVTLTEGQSITCTLTNTFVQ